MRRWIRRLHFRYHVWKIKRLLRRFEATVLEPGADVQLLVRKIRKDILSAPAFTGRKKDY